MLDDLLTHLVSWTGTLIAPDWGGLVALIPVLLLLVVAAFVAVTAAKWARVGRAGRGRGRRLPRAADGSQVGSPTLGPLALALAAFLAAFGLVAGGLWLVVGLLVALAGVALWRRERRADGLPASGRRVR